MRDILFRGKSRDTDEWEYGGIVHQTDYYGDPADKWFIIDGTITQDYDIGFETEVNPDTVGQFTGIYDREGKRIFDGDIVSSFGGITHEVIFDGGAFFMEGTALPFSYVAKYKVIGNRWDNPELLK